jgi:hypothetical protein
MMVAAIMTPPLTCWSITRIGAGAEHDGLDDLANEFGDAVHVRREAAAGQLVLFDIGVEGDPAPGQRRQHAHGADYFGVAQAGVYVARRLPRAGRQPLQLFMR